MFTNGPPALPGAEISNAKRRKVSRACDRCKARKRRCNGQQPCAPCLEQCVPCVYNTPYLRGRLVLPEPPQRRSGAAGDASNLSSERPRQSPSEPYVPQYNNPLKAALSEEPSARDISRSSRAASPTGEGITEPGHYLGPTSTFSFLRRAGRRFGRIAAGEARDIGDRADVSIFANGDVALAAEDDGKVDFPEETTMRLLVSRYFDFAVPSHRFFHQPTVNDWIQAVHEPIAPRHRTLRPIREAAMLLIMATSLLYKVDEHGNATGPTDIVGGPDSQILRERYCQAARSRLQNEKGVARLESVQARLACVLYLLNTSRLNQAWYLLGTTNQLIIALGLHSSRSSIATENDCIAQECKKRCYWVAFTIDTYFSVMLGRPPLMSKQGVDQPYPSMANDENITTDSASYGTAIRDCVQAAPVFHARIAQIIREASSEQYSAHKSATQRQLHTVQRLNGRIANWHEELPVFLSGRIHPSTLVPIFRRQSRVLQMAAAHATMLVNRPLLLYTHSETEQIRPHIAQCLSAAQKVLEIVLELVEQNHLFRAFWNFQYITFHALSVIYVWIIQLKGDRIPMLQTQHDKQHLYSLAEMVQAHLAEATQLNALNLRYSIILEELRQEALRALRPRGSRLQHAEAAPAVPHGDINLTPGQVSQFDAMSDWDSVLDFPADPELWLQLDSFPFDGKFALNGPVARANHIS